MTNQLKVESRKDIICLFDVDGTLTPARQMITSDVKRTLDELKKHCIIGFVGGSDLVKQQEQLGSDATQYFDYAFSENGLTAFHQGKPLPSESIKDFLGEDNLKLLINFMLHYIADLDIPKKRGTFVEFRKSMINVSPIGRNCSPEERDEFERYDLVHGVRKKFVEILRQKFQHLNLKYSIGGQISFDVFPESWDKTYCLRHLEKEGFKQIHFFGDKTFVGGNDYEIFTDPRVIGHTVTGPADTIRLIRELFFSQFVGK